jgi:predicted Zn-dependent protease/TolB-like protein
MAGKCNNGKFGEMLHAYELNLLTDEDREAFELHLLECEYCACEVGRLHDVSRLLSHDPLVNLNLEKIAAEKKPDSITPDEKESYQRPRIFHLAGAIAVAAAIITFLILSPWDIIVTSQKPAMAENLLTVMFFENIQDPSDTTKIGEIATNLLINDFSESGYLPVLSSQRLYDIMRLLEFSGLTRLDKNIASRVAEKANAKWILNGAILRTEPTIIISAQLSDAASGTVIASQEIAGRPGEDIFTLTDSLALALEKDFSLSIGLPAISGIKSTQTGSRSREAWRYYLEGIDNYNRIYLKEAIESFEKALTFDSTLAMAYCYLAILKDPQLMQMAYKYSANASIKDKYYINILKANFSHEAVISARLLREFLDKYPDDKLAYFWLSRIETTRNNILQTAVLLNKTIALDSLYKMAYINLIYTYISLDSFPAALHIADKYAEIAPDEPNPYDCRGDIYSAMGENEKALNFLNAAMKIRPDFGQYGSLKKAIILEICQGDDSKIDSCNKIISSRDPGQKYWLAPYLKIYRGDIYRAINYYDSALVFGDSLPYYHFNKARLFDELSEPQRALAEISPFMEMMNELYPNERLAYRNLYIYFLARAGLYDSAYSQADQLGKWCSEREYPDRYYNAALGTIELVKKDYAKASAYFDKASAPSRDFSLFYLAGQAYLFGGQYDKAISILERITRECPLKNANGIWAIEAHYYLGRAYEGAGRMTDAKAEYQYIAGLWKNADPPLAWYEDLKNRLLQP